MSSRKKGSGSGAVSMVAEAIKRSGSTVEEFFKRAGVRGPGAGEVMERFKKLRDQGPAAAPGYKIPRQVIQLASK